MRHLLATALGKTVRKVAGLRGGGSAAPGLIAEKIDPHFLPKALENLPFGVVVVSGTNGKTTTTKMLVEILQGAGLSVFTNRSGSNFTRGIVASVLGEKGLRGVVQSDIAVLELDEAHAVHFIKLVKPRTSLLLNVMRDQLDRFGEIDYTASLLAQVAEATQEALVLNREDPRIRRLGVTSRAHSISYYGLSPLLRQQFPTDDEMRAGAAPTAQASEDLPPAGVTLLKVNSQEGRNQAVIDVDGVQTEVSLQVNGLYNTFNAVAAIACAEAVLGDSVPTSTLIGALERVTPAFGRGESLSVNGQPLELVLVKNPAGFRLALQSFDPEGCATMIAINDQYADGRDMSWLWDVDFDSLRDTGVEMVSGTRSADMALRLNYDDVPVASVEENLKEALAAFLGSGGERPKRIYATYTAMLALRRLLAKVTEVKAVS